MAKEISSGVRPRSTQSANSHAEDPFADVFSAAAKNSIDSDPSNPVRLTAASFAGDELIAAPKKPVSVCDALREPRSSRERQEHELAKQFLVGALDGLRIDMQEKTLLGSLWRDQIVPRLPWLSVRHSFAEERLFGALMEQLGGSNQVSPRVLEQVVSLLSSARDSSHAIIDVWRALEQDPAALEEILSTPVPSKAHYSDNLMTDILSELERAGRAAGLPKAYTAREIFKFQFQRHIPGKLIRYHRGRSYLRDEIGKAFHLEGPSLNEFCSRLFKAANADFTSIAKAVKQDPHLLASLAKESLRLSSGSSLD